MFGTGGLWSGTGSFEDGFGVCCRKENRKQNAFTVTIHRYLFKGGTFSGVCGSR